MELTERIETLNQRLIDIFGIDTISTLPIWRIVWTNDQFEKRLSNYTASGVQLLYPQMMELPKYSYIKDKYILECLTAVPDINADELVTRISYEPRYCYEDAKGNYLPPTWLVTKFAIDTLNAASGKESLRKYVDPESTSEQAIAAKEERIRQLEQEIFDSTSVSDALHIGTGVAGFHSKIGNKEKN